MTIEELRAKLAESEKRHLGDWEALHSEQDDCLLAYIGDAEVVEIFNRTPKWCA